MGSLRRLAFLWLGLQLCLLGTGAAQTRPQAPVEIPGQVVVADVLAYGSKPEPLLLTKANPALQLAYPLGQWADSMDPWGWRYSESKAAWRMHTGVDLAAPSGTPVLAAKAGRVALVQAVAGYGNTVLLDHGDGVETLYAHLQEALVREGDWIDQGAQLGAVGMTGAATGPHLHFELRNRAQALQAIDPTPHLPPLMAPPQIAGGVATLVP
jgi:murein DD-endopeptidase MepM/ murein hydrolase activator NlpD